jgi:TonB-dependent receptor
MCRNRMACGLVLMAALLSAGRLGAQERYGAIAGTVSDAGHYVLPGARIAIEPRGLSAVSDQQGRFTIQNVPSGDYTLTISYVGLLPHTELLTVVAGESVRVDAVLQVAGVREEVTVSVARPRGEAQALNRERTADNIVQVLPAEVITSLPNTNIADAVGRLPSVSLERDEGEGKYVQIRGTDPRLSNVTINGVNVPSPEGGVRNVKLDVIPSDLVASIEVNKTLSASQDGDAIGGSVNLVTKTAADQMYAAASAMGGYTNIVGGRALDQFSATVGGRVGADRRLGILAGGTYDWNGRGIDDIEPSPDMFQSTPVVAAIDLREYRYYRSRLGFAGGLDYRLQRGTSAYVRGLFSNFKNYGDRWVYSPGAGDFLTPTTTDANGTMDFGIQNRRPNEQIYSVAGGAKHIAGAWLVDYDLSGSHARQDRLGQSTVGFTGPDNVAYRIDTSDPNVPTFTVTNGVNVFNPALYSGTSLATADDRARQRDFGGALNLTRAYATGSGTGAVQAGFKMRDADKSQVSNDQTFAVSGLPLTAVIGSFSNPQFYGGAYQLGPLADLDAILSYLAGHPGSTTLNVDSTRQKSDSSTYGASERVTAGYLMNTIDNGRAHLQTGVRVEHTHASYDGNIVVLNRSGRYVSTTPVSGDQHYTDVLPSVQLRVSLDANTNVRVAYGRGIARPNFSDLPPYLIEQDKKKTISVGNPALQPTSANNVDVLFERFLEPVGVIQAGVFYKALRNPIYRVQSPVATGVFAGFTQTQPTNGDSASVAGVEMAWQQHLTFLPGALSGLGVRANYSYTTSRASVPGRTDDPALLRQAPNNWNLDATYDRGGLSARIGVTHNDANIFAYNFQPGADGGITGPNGDQYLYAHTQVDAQASYALSRQVQVVLSLLNLNNEVFGFYQGSPQYPVQREFYNRTVSVGIRLNRNK